MDPAAQFVGSQRGTRVAIPGEPERMPIRMRFEATKASAHRGIAAQNWERTMEEQSNKTMKVVWTVVDRGQGKSFWTRVGVGFVNRDGSLTLRLDAVPINGTLQVREWQEPYDRRAEPAEPGARPRGKQQSTGDSLL
jgi:hypothetical protein